MNLDYLKVGDKIKIIALYVENDEQLIEGEDDIKSQDDRFYKYSYGKVFTIKDIDEADTYPITIEEGPQTFNADEIEIFKITNWKERLNL